MSLDYILPVTAILKRAAITLKSVPRPYFSLRPSSLSVLNTRVSRRRSRDLRAGNHQDTPRANSTLSEPRRLGWFKSQSPDLKYVQRILKLEMPEEGERTKKLFFVSSWVLGLVGRWETKNLWEWLSCFFFLLIAIPVRLNLPYLPNSMTLPVWQSAA